MSVLWIIIGLVGMLAGAELLVRGGSRLATLLGVPPLLVGLTVVAFGTSFPELVVSMGAGFQGRADLAAGNVVGSNIFNILVILGLSAIVAPPLVASLRVIRWEVPTLITVSLLPSLLARDGSLSRPEAFFMVVVGVGWVVWQIRQAQAEPKAVQESTSASAKSIIPHARAISVGQVIAGLVLLVVGSRLFVDGAASLARSLGVSELIIGLTVVAAGTSLPEVAASVTAALRGERDMAIGNVLGSNIFNILFVLGLSTAVSAPQATLPETLSTFDMPVMIVLSIICLPIFFTDQSVTRWEGIGLLLAYGGYMTLQILAATGSPYLDMARNAILAVAVAAMLLALSTAFRQLAKSKGWL